MPIVWFTLFCTIALLFSLLDGGDALAFSRDCLADSAPALGALARRRGRPRKFASPSRAVTLTLPVSVIAALSAIHADLSQAIVHLTRRGARRGGRKAADLVVYGQRAVITVRPTRSLELREGVELVPLPDGRALIALDDATSLAALQLSIADALDDRDVKAEDRQVYEQLSEILRDARRSDAVSLEQRRIIVLDSTGRPRSNGRRASNGRHSRR
jgi:hypothetical protein